MCGIAGIINREIHRDSPYEPIREMTDIVRHRGPDGEGQWLDDGIALGHRRLSIIDLSSLGHQPMIYMDRYVITYNGEVYNYIELRNELEANGYSFRSHSDTEVILAGYDCWKEACLDKYNGMFSFAIYDMQEKTVFCARDRFGVKPFYYAQIGDSFVFGSEIKQFTVLRGWRAICDARTAADFLVYGIQDHTERTFFKDVFQLRGGHYLKYELANHTYRICKWYDLLEKKNGAVAAVPEGDVSERFYDLLSDSVRFRLRSDVKVGSCLSGGLDSSSIVSIVNEQLRLVQAHDRQETVTSCFDDKKFDEREYADEVVRATGAVNHKVFPSFDALFGELEDMVWHQDEPFLSTSIYAQWNVFRTAGENEITVMLDGQGADEMLGGYPTFFAPNLLSMLRRGQFGRFLTEFNGIRRNTPYSAAWIGKQLLKNGIGKQRSDALRECIHPGGAILGARYPGGARPKLTYSDFKEMSYAQLTATNLPMLLHYEDRNSMAFSIESRVPFLDYRLVEFVFQLQEKHLISEGRTKYVLREAMRNRIPDKVLGRRDKMGFVTAEEQWLKDHPADFEKHIRAAIDGSNGFISPDCLKIFQQMKEGKLRFDFVLWRIISFGAWIKKFDVQV